jgi:hypothetical protein
MEYRQFTHTTANDKEVVFTVYHDGTGQIGETEIDTIENNTKHKAMQRYMRLFGEKIVNSWINENFVFGA